MIIWIASYPRSGNTLLRLLIKHYYGLRTYSIYQDSELAQSPFVVNLIGHASRPISIDAMKLAEEVYLVKTHELPDDESPAVCLVRDGRDALVSYAHYILSYERETASQAQDEQLFHTLRDLILYNASFGGWGPNVLAWARRSSPTSIIKFEDLAAAADPLPIVNRALDKIGFSTVVPVASGKPPSFDELHRQMPQFFRVGKIGGWRDEMPSELLKLFWERNHRAMDPIGYADA